MKSNQPFPQPICEQIWNEKYRLITPNTEIPDDMSVDDTFQRIARACANAEPELYGDFKAPTPEYHKAWEKRFKDTLDDFKFLPAGRITAGAGSGRSVTLFNCYVMGTIPDSMDGIFSNLREAALTMQQGGGIGYDFSTLRPSNSLVKGVDADASGPLSFMDVWNAMCKTIMSAGSRRGAMMATMRCDHPDIEDFITAKQDSDRLRMFNMSMLATDAFMNSVEDNNDWPLVHAEPPMLSEWNGAQLAEDGKVVYNQPGLPYIHKIIPARDLWDLMMKATYNFAEPGILFVDRINKMNNLWYVEHISATNPCGEQPLPPYGACLLGSVNLTKMVSDPFKETAGVDTKLLKKTAKTATRMLDAVIDISNFPLEAQRAEAKAKRRMGIGVTGLADMLFMVGHTYGTPEAAAFAEEVQKIITIACYEESIDLAKEFGPCPVTKTKAQRKQFLQSGFMQNMPEYIHEGIMEHGIRNALLVSIAPTGTISLYAGNVSSGVEPIFAPEYTRKVLEKDGSKREERVFDYAVQVFKDWSDDQDGGHFMDHHLWKKNMVTAQTLSPMDHIVMQSAVQKWIDSSISKTINCPEDISFKDFKAVYLEAYRTGCKGCTTYRPNDVTGSVLSVESDKKDEGPTETVKYQTEPMPRPESLQGHTYKIDWQGNAAYVTINDFTSPEGKKIPFEIFINSKQMDHFQWTVALTRMISAVFRRGGDVSFVVEELKNVFDPKGGTFVKGKGYVPSFIALLGATLETHLKSIGYLPGDETLLESVTEEETQETGMQTPDQCGSCGGFNVVKEAGCPICKDCGYSKCG